MNIAFSVTLYSERLCIEKKDCRLFYPKYLLQNCIRTRDTVPGRDLWRLPSLHPPASGGWGSMGTLGTISQCCTSEEGGFLIIQMSFRCLLFTFTFMTHTVIFLAHLSVRKNEGKKQTHTF